MNSCTFFGHRRINKKIEPMLKSVLQKLILSCKVNMFYIGNNGDFDCLVYKTLHDLSKTYNIRFYVVLSGVPVKKNYAYYDFGRTIVPEGIEKVHPKFAIDYRNRWMLKNSNYVVTFIENEFNSCAAKYKDLSVKAGKNVIELSGAE